MKNRYIGNVGFFSFPTQNSLYITPKSSYDALEESISKLTDYVFVCESKLSAAILNENEPATTLWRVLLLNARHDLQEKSKRRWP